MANRAPLPSDVRLAVGLAVLGLRQDNVDWKLLETRFDRSRVTLWRYAHLAMTADPTAANETLFPDNETSPA